MILYYVRGVRQNMVKGAARVNDLIGPFDTWSEASRYATAWRALWVQQHAKAFVETPITPCSDTLEWYGAKVERDDAAELARRERAADDMFASEAREATRPGDSAVAQWFADDARETAREACKASDASLAYSPIHGRDLPELAPGEFRFK